MRSADLLESKEGCGRALVLGAHEHVNRGFSNMGPLSKSGRTISWAIPRHSCSNSGAGLLSGLMRVPQEFAVDDMAGRGLAQSEELAEEESGASQGVDVE